MCNIQLLFAKTFFQTFPYTFHNSAANLMVIYPVLGACRPHRQPEKTKTKTKNIQKFFFSNYNCVKFNSCLQELFSNYS